MRLPAYSILPTWTPSTRHRSEASSGYHAPSVPAGHSIHPRQARPFTPPNSPPIPTGFSIHLARDHLRWSPGATVRLAGLNVHPGRIRRSLLPGCTVHPVQDERSSQTGSSFILTGSTIEPGRVHRPPSPGSSATPDGFIGHRVHRRSESCGFTVHPRQVRRPSRWSSTFGRRTWTDQPVRFNVHPRRRTDHHPRVRRRSPTGSIFYPSGINLQPCRRTLLPRGFKLLPPRVQAPTPRLQAPTPGFERPEPTSMISFSSTAFAPLQPHHLPPILRL